VAQLAHGTFHAGRYSARWSGELEGGGKAPAGVYFIRYRTPAKTLTKRVAIIR
jgi:hypothetical protein